jgi:hypothetical protein
MMVSSENMVAVVFDVETTSQRREQKVSKMKQLRSALFRTKGSVIIAAPFLALWHD